MEKTTYQNCRNNFYRSLSLSRVFQITEKLKIEAARNVYTQQDIKEAGIRMNALLDVERELHKI